jgi:hypothetical protein
MRISLANTDQFETINGARARAWVGENENGISIVAYIVAIQVRNGIDVVDFERELREIEVNPAPASAEILAAQADDRQLSLLDNVLRPPLTDAQLEHLERAGEWRPGIAGIVSLEGGCHA